MPNDSLLDVEWFEPPPRNASSEPSVLPNPVNPCPDEALASWMLRYAAPLAVPPETLLIDARDANLLTGPAWWRRPDPLLLTQLAARIGVTRAELTATTFTDWVIDTWDDALAERFSHWRFRFPQPAQRRSQRIAVCPQCLAEDPAPYIRKHWTVGWVSVCDVHERVLIGSCPECRYKLRLQSLDADELFAPDKCKRCGLRMTTVTTRSAHELALKLQALLLTYRAQPAVPLPAMGEVQWPVLMAFFDVLLGMVWNGAKVRFRHQLFARMRHDLDLTEDIGEGPYDGLLILAWFLDRWPQRFQMAVATLKVPRPRRQLDRWEQLDAGIKSELERIFIPAWPDESNTEGRGWWRDWIDELPLTGEELRQRAVSDRFACRRIRLLALADVRDGLSVEDAAHLAGVLPKTLYRWLKRGAAGGLQAALERPHGKLSQLQALEISTWIASASPAEPRWRTDRVQNEVYRRFGVEISVDVARRLLQGCGPWPRMARRIPVRRVTLCTLPITKA